MKVSWWIDRKGKIHYESNLALLIKDGNKIVLERAAHNPVSSAPVDFSIEDVPLSEISVLAFDLQSQK